jgi:hypothetical protein
MTDMALVVLVLMSVYPLHSAKAAAWALQRSRQASAQSATNLALS